METPNYRKGSIIFDDDTILQVEQRGGGGSGVGGETGLAAVNLITGESTNAALAEKDETIEQQATTIETQAATIIELQEELADVPTIEALSVTANGTYSESGKAYSPVIVNVPASDDLISYQIRVNIQSTDKKVLYYSGGHQSPIHIGNGTFNLVTYVSRKNTQTDNAFLDFLTDATSRTSNLIAGCSASLSTDSAISNILPGWKQLRIGIAANVSLDPVRINDIGTITLA